MRTIRLLFCLVVLIFSFSLSFGQGGWLWGKAGTGTIKANVYGDFVATDIKGNAYISGMFDNSITFTPYTLTHASDNSYIVKYNSAGNIKWAIIDINDPYGAALATDNAGYLYLTSNDYVMNDMYFRKLDSNGNTVWNEVPTYFTGSSYGQAISFDKNGFIYVAGTFTGKLAFASDTLNATNSGGQVFILKFDLNGNIIWARQSGPSTTAYINSANSVHADNTGNVYVTGSFDTAVQFGSYHFTAPQRNAICGIFYVKYDANGNLKWAVNPYTPPSYAGATGTSVVTDNANNSYLAGYFDDSIKFGPITLGNGNGLWTVFLAKYDTNGQVMWAQQALDSSENPSLAADSSYVFMGGSCQNSFSFGGMSWGKPEQSDFFIQLDTSGKAHCGTLIDAPSQGTGIACDPYGRFCYLAGFSYDTVYAGPDTLIPLHGGAAPFVARWQACTCSMNVAMDFQSSDTICNTAGTISLFGNPAGGTFSGSAVYGNFFYPDSAKTGVYNVFHYSKYDTGCYGIVSDSIFVKNCNGTDISNLRASNQPLIIYPNPNNGVFTIGISGKEQGISEVEIYNMLGEKVYQSTLNANSTQINMLNQAKGVYLYRILTEDGSPISSGKFVIER